jgi:hypothetical protein
MPKMDYQLIESFYTFVGKICIGSIQGRTYGKEALGVVILLILKFIFIDSNNVNYIQVVSLCFECQGTPLYLDNVVIKDLLGFTWVDLSTLTRNEMMCFRASDSFHPHPNMTDLLFWVIFVYLGDAHNCHYTFYFS